MDIEAVGNRLLETGPDFWAAAQRRSASYPKGGLSSCFDIEDESFWFQHRNACVAAIVERFPPGGVTWKLFRGNLAGK
jgi:hypothetical protein